jgi:hypothetical protein
MSVPKIVLDPRNDAELLAQAYIRVTNASGGRITANQPGSALMALLEGQTYLTAELLWYLNKLPEALALEVLRLTGITRITGSKAYGSLLVTLTNVLGNAFILSSGTVLGQYVTTQDLVIVSGGVQGSVQVEAINAGSQGNAKAYSIRLGSITTYVQDVFNNAPIIGGSDLEPVEAYLDRVQRGLRLRSTLVSEEDYNIAAVELAGGQTIAVANTFPLISGDKVTKATGNVHTFLAYLDYSIPSVDTLYAIKSTMQARCYIGSSVWVSNATYFPVSLDIVVATSSLSDQIADDIYAALLKYVNPARYLIGSTLSINECEYITRGVVGVNRVTTLFINNSGLDAGMPAFYAYPLLDTVNITLVDTLGRNTTFYRGSGSGQ